MLLGVQTIGQLRDVYGQSIDRVIGNCNQVIGFSPGNDTGETVDFYQSIIGERQETVTSTSKSHDEIEEPVVKDRLNGDKLVTYKLPVEKKRPVGNL
jgi:type IV secretory pathway TraG/TraD family ATPase VirD4